MSTAIVGRFGPGLDRVVQPVAGGPSATVQDIVMQQRVLGLHRGVVACGGNAAHGALKVGGSQPRAEVVRSGLRASVWVHHDDTGWLASGDGGAQHGAASWAVIGSSIA